MTGHALKYLIANYFQHNLLDYDLSWPAISFGHDFSHDRLWH